MTKSEINALRFECACRVMQGLCSQREVRQAEPERVAKVCVTLTDALVKELLSDSAIDQENNSENKLQTKFKVGDFVIHDNYPDEIYQVANTYKDCEHELVSIDGDSEKNIPYASDEYMRKWTIKDAKPGDILITDCGSLFVYNGYLEEQKWAFAYCGFDMNDNFISDESFPFTHGNVYPATNEQRTAFFDKLNKVGYKWNNMELKLEEIQEECTESDTVDFYKSIKEWCINHFKECAKFSGNNSSYKIYLNNKVIPWLEEHLKDTWTEDDEYYHNIILYILNNEFVGKTDKENAINWFKSLRLQNTRKPTDEQMKVLKEAVDERFDIDGGALWHLYEDLKKLMEE